MSKGTGNFKFKAEVQQVLDILVHSLYSNKEIFLRELISNASDALDKLRFEQQRGREIADADLELEIRLDANQDDNTLTVTDTGLGMTRDELVENIGTIAHSGTSQFVKRLKEAKDQATVENVIGQFGVGFYSVFMVADEVRITTRSYEESEPAWVWKSKGEGSFTVSPVQGEVPRGTTIEIKLKDDEKRFAEPDTLREIIKRHSNFINFPIYVEGERVNTISALWREPKFQIEKEQYEEFYKFLTFDSEGPLDTIHVSADAPIQFNALLFVPPKNRDLLMGSYQGQRGLDLYVRRILIQHENKDILPEYLGFLRGVVDSEDLPLNVSRETLQENLLLRKIGNSLVKHVLSNLQKTAKDDPERYETLWREHGPIFKLGYSDLGNREKFAELLRFNSSHHDDDKGLTSLEAYADRMLEGQKAIYYLAGNSRQAIEASPHLELFRRKGVEVLYLTEPVDDFVMDALGEFKDHKVVSVENADVADLDAFADQAEGEDAPEKLSEEEATSLDGLIGRMKELLGDRVKDVVRSKRLKDSPVCLVSPDGQMTSSMQKIMRYMTKDESVPQKIMEINPDAPLIRNLLRIYKSNPQDEYLGLATEQLFESALLQEGYLTDPHGLVKRIQDHLAKSSTWYEPGA